MPWWGLRSLCAGSPSSPVGVLGFFGAQAPLAPHRLGALISLVLAALANLGALPLVLAARTLLVPALRRRVVDHVRGWIMSSSLRFCARIS